MRTKYFYYFQSLRVLRCHWFKRLNRVNCRSKWPLQKTFSSLTPPPAWISRVFDPPPARISRIPSVGGRGCRFLLEQPITVNYLQVYFEQQILALLLVFHQTRNLSCNKFARARANQPISAPHFFNPQEIFLLRVKLIKQGEKCETSTKTCNETMLRNNLRVLYLVFCHLKCWVQQCQGQCLVKNVFIF